VALEDHHGSGSTYSGRVLASLRILAFLVLLAAAPGCGDDAPEGTERAQATATAVPEEPAARRGPVGTRVRVRAEDGKALRARLAVASRRAPAVIVFHTSDNARAAFDGLAAELHEDGYTVLALDARYTFHSLREVTDAKDERGLARDVLGALAFLRRSDDVRPDRVGIVAQSMGAAGAALALARTPEAVDAAVALSPPDSTHVLDLQLEDDYAPRGILFVADAAELQNAQNLAEGAADSEVWQTPVDGHGYELLPDRKVRERLHGWLDARLSG
jgi:Serine aminopeptidase, S33